MPCNVNYEEEIIGNGKILNMFLYKYPAARYSIGIDFETNETRLWKKNMDGKGSTKLLNLNYIIDVNPQNIEEWIARLLKLSSFS
jgi:hypothetical protein